MESYSNSISRIFLLGRPVSTFVEILKPKYLICKPQFEKVTPYNKLHCNVSFILHHLKSVSSKPYVQMVHIDGDVTLIQRHKKTAVELQWKQII